MKRGNDSGETGLLSMGELFCVKREVDGVEVAVVGSQIVRKIKVLTGDGGSEDDSSSSGSDSDSDVEVQEGERR